MSRCPQEWSGTLKIAPPPNGYGVTHRSSITRARPRGSLNLLNLGPTLPAGRLSVSPAVGSSNPRGQGVKSVRESLWEKDANDSHCFRLAPYFPLDGIWKFTTNGFTV